MTNFFPIRAKILSAPTSKRLTNLSCLDLRKEIQEASRKNLRMNTIWNNFIYEICERVSKYVNLPRGEKTDKFTPTDISLIFESFSPLKKNNRQFYNYLLECVNMDIDNYTIRDVSVLYNSLTKLNVSNQLIFDNLNKVVLNKLDNKVSEKDISLLLNAILALKVENVKDLFLKCSLVLSSRIKFIDNLHTLTLLLHSYSKLFYVIDTEPGNPNFEKNFKSDERTLLYGEKGVEVNNYEYIILTDTTISLLSKSFEMITNMRPTDLLYFYRSFINLVFGRDESKRNVYSNVVKLYKVHNQIIKSKLEFQTRELIVLMELLRSSYDLTKIFNFGETQLVEDGSSQNLENLNDTKYDDTTLEIYRNNPKIEEELKNELTYRVRLMSIKDCVNFAKMINSNDETLELIFSRLYDKLNRDKIWETHCNNDLFDILDIVSRRIENISSDVSKGLVAVLSEKIPKFLKLKELCSLMRECSLLGVKTNSLERKLGTVRCRSESLEDDQFFIILHSSVSLGYLEVLDSLLGDIYRVKDEEHSVKLLMDLSILRFNSLKEICQEMVDHLNRNIINRVKYRDVLLYISEINKKCSDNLNFKSDINKMVDISEDSYNNTNLGTENTVETNEKFETYIDINLIRTNYNYFCNSKVFNYNELLEEFINDFEIFIDKHEYGMKLRKDFKVGGFIFPLVLELNGKILSFVPLFDDFYTIGKKIDGSEKKMMKLNKFTQIKLLEKLNIVHITFDLYKYSQNKDKDNSLANLLQQSLKKLKEGSLNVEVTTEISSRIENINTNGSNINEIRKSLSKMTNKSNTRISNSFERFRSSLSV